MQLQALKQGALIVVANPGRLIDFIHKKHIRLDDIEITVLDQAIRRQIRDFCQN
jgi:superfamily II DNA/RNA helicase